MASEQRREVSGSRRKFRRWWTTVLAGTAGPRGRCTAPVNSAQAVTQRVPLSVNAVGLVLLPVQVPLNPKFTVPPLAPIVALYEALVAVTVAAGWLTVAFQAWVTFWPLANVQTTLHPLIADAPVLVTVTAPVKPPPPPHVLAL